jgi:hypothetical protein
MVEQLRRVTAWIADRPIELVVHAGPPVRPLTRAEICLGAQNARAEFSRLPFTISGTGQHL